MQPVCLKAERNIGFSATVSPRPLNVAATSLSDFFHQLGTRPQRIGTSSRAPSRTRTAIMAAALYFLILFGVGLLLGPIRQFWRSECLNSYRFMNGHRIQFQLRLMER